jgi:hypothetical protein
MRRGRSFARAEARNAIRARNRARGAGDSITSSCGRLRAQGVALGDCMVRTIGSRPGAVGRLLSGLPQAHGGPPLAGLIPSRLTALCQEPQRGGDTSARGSAPGGSWRPSEEDGNNVSLPPLARASIFCASVVAAPFRVRFSPAGTDETCMAHRRLKPAATEDRRYWVRSTPLFKYMQEGDTEHP